MCNMGDSFVHWECCTNSRHWPKLSPVDACKRQAWPAPHWWHVQWPCASNPYAPQDWKTALLNATEDKSADAAFALQYKQLVKVIWQKAASPPHIDGIPYPVGLLYNGLPLTPSKLPFPMGDLDPHLIHGFLRPPSHKNPNGISSVQPRLQGSRLTNRPHYIGNNRPRLRTHYIVLRCGLSTAEQYISRHF